MNNHSPPEIDMRPDGSFVDPPEVPLSAKIFRIALVVAILGAALAGAVLLIGFALFMIPVAIGSAVIAWGAFRYRMWKMGRSAGGGRDIFSG
jgi:hypothetical protein